MSKPPAFQLYADDFLAGTIDMTPEETGIYIKLLCLQWSKGAVPADLNRLGAVACGSSLDTLQGVLDAKFSLTDQGWQNVRLEKVREIQKARSDAGKNGGKQNASKRASKTQANAKQKGKQNASKHPSKTPSKTQAKGQAKSNPPVSSLQSPSPGGVTEKNHHQKSGLVRFADYTDRLEHTLQTVPSFAQEWRRLQAVNGFRAAWDGWVQYRIDVGRDDGQPVMFATLTSQLQQLAENLGSKDPLEVIQRSISKGSRKGLYFTDFDTPRPGQSRDGPKPQGRPPQLNLKGTA